MTNSHIILEQIQKHFKLNTTQVCDSYAQLCDSYEVVDLSDNAQYCDIDILVETSQLVFTYAHKDDVDYNQMTVDLNDIESVEENLIYVKAYLSCAHSTEFINERNNT